MGFTFLICVTFTTELTALPVGEHIKLMYLTVLFCFINQKNLATHGRRHLSFKNYALYT